MNLAPPHVDVLGHRRAGMAQLIGCGPGGKAALVDQCGDRLAETVAGDVWQPSRISRYCSTANQEGIALAVSGVTPAVE